MTISACSKTDWLPVLCCWVCIVWTHFFTNFHFAAKRFLPWHIKHIFPPVWDCSLPGSWQKVKKQHSFLSFDFLNRLITAFVLTFYAFSSLKTQDSCTTFSISLQISMHLYSFKILTFINFACLSRFSIYKTIWSCNINTTYLSQKLPVFINIYNILAFRFFSNSSCETQNVHMWH